MFLNISELYDEFFLFETDERVRDKLLMGDPDTLIAICCVYAISTIIFTKYLKKNPEKIVNNMSTPILIMHMFYLISTCYVLYGIVKYMIWSNYNFRCHEYDKSNRKEVLEVIR